MWGDPDERREKKIYKIGKSAAYSIGGGIALKIFALLYPKPDNAKAEAIANMFGGPVSWLLIIYGIIMLAVIVTRRNAAPPLNLLFLLFVIPACLLYIFVNNWPG